MKFLPIFLVLVVCLVGKGYADTIQCYECDDCGNLSDSQLQSCPAEVSTTTPSDTTVPSSTSPDPNSSSSSTELSSSEPATSPSESTEQSTLASSDPGTSPSAPTEQSTLASSEPGTSPSAPTEQSTLASSEPGTSPSAPTEQSTLASSEPGTSPSAPTEQSTLASLEPETSPSAPTEQSTLASSEPGTSPSAPTEQGAAAISQGDSEGIKPNVIQVLSHRRSYRSVLRAGPTYHCYSLNRVDGDSQKVKRGCVEVPEDSTPCDVLKGELGESIQNCKSCQKDKCNSSAALKFSLVTFVIAIVIGVLCK